ncbi:MAG: HEAT repeat domain-containing protein, partial [Methanothrix sp.]|uniref:HEAT repeat domain-containing protein n=1 Tax=Methanothrix sp. TaxID=90426 RepID=UPI003D91CA52
MRMVTALTAIFILIACINVCSSTNQYDSKILSNMNNSNTATKLLAFASIADRGDAGLDLMARGFNSDDADFKAFTFIWMNIVEMDNPRALELLAESLSGGDEDTRLLAALSLGWKRDPAAVDSLIKSLEDESIAVRTLSAISLGW